MPVESRISWPAPVTAHQPESGAGHAPPRSAPVQTKSLTSETSPSGELSSRMESCREAMPAAGTKDTGVAVS